MIFGEPNSGGALLAGAEASAKASPPTNSRSTEDSLRFRAQLRSTFAHRSRADYRNPTSVEKGAHRRKAPAPVSRPLIGEQMRRVAHLRGTSVGRRLENCGRPNSGEAAVVGGDDYFGVLLRRGTACPELPKLIKLRASSIPDAGSIFLL